MASSKTTVKKMSQGYGYKYSDLSTIHEELERQGITYWQETRWDEQAGADYIYTHLRYGDDKEWEPERRGVKVIDTTEAKMNAAQAQGSGVTYARRYSLLMALGWATEDDDGASVGKPSAKQVATTAQPPRNKPWQKYGPNTPTAKQVEWIKDLLKQGGADEKATDAYMKKITSFDAASKAIDTLKKALEEKKNGAEEAPMPTDEELEQIDFEPAEESA